MFGLLPRGPITVFAAPTVYAVRLSVQQPPHPFTYHSISCLSISFIHWLAPTAIYDTPIPLNLHCTSPYLHTSIPAPSASLYLHTRSLRLSSPTPTLPSRVPPPPPQHRSLAYHASRPLHCRGGGAKKEEGRNRRRRRREGKNVVWKKEETCRSWVEERRKKEVGGEQEKEPWVWALIPASSGIN
jgi:hypothetical protein